MRPYRAALEYVVKTEDFDRTQPGDWAEADDEWKPFDMGPSLRFAGKLLRELRERVGPGKYHEMIRDIQDLSRRGYRFAVLELESERKAESGEM